MAICVAESNHLRGIKQKFAWQKIRRTCHALHVRRSGAGQRSGRTVCNTAPTHVAVRGSRHCHAALSAPPPPQILPRRFCFLPCLCLICHADVCFLLRGFCVSATQIFALCHAIFNFLPRRFLLSGTQFFSRASERRVILITGVCQTSSLPHIFTSSHLHIFTSSHPHIFTFSLAPLLSCPFALLPSCSLALLPSPSFLFLS